MQVLAWLKGRRRKRPVSGSRVTAERDGRHTAHPQPTDVFLRRRCCHTSVPIARLRRVVVHGWGQVSIWLRRSLSAGDRQIHAPWSLCRAGSEMPGPVLLPIESPAQDPQLCRLLTHAIVYLEDPLPSGLITSYREATMVPFRISVVEFSRPLLRITTGRSSPQVSHTRLSPLTAPHAEHTTASAPPRISGPRPGPPRRWRSRRLSSLTARRRYTAPRRPRGPAPRRWFVRRSR
jgi:hypothetical protein